jgi:hypothetical protein
MGQQSLWWHFKHSCAGNFSEEEKNTPIVSENANINI